MLLAGLVVALALVAMLTAYLQLGYHADVTAGGADRPVQDSATFLDRATHESARDLRGSHAWSERERTQAVSEMRSQLDPRLDTLERSRVPQGVVSRATYNETAASEWAGEHCPGGRGKAFSPCRADRGVVVQGRDGRTLVIAVAYDLNVTTEDGSTRLTTVVTATS